MSIPSPAEPQGRQLLRSRVVTPSELSESQRQRMHQLMEEHFHNVPADRFQSDLAEKDWVVLMESADAMPQGFTTLRAYEAVVGDQRVTGFYSGDTILARAFWGDHGWLATWAQHVFHEADRRPDQECYWILLTATHRTYRFLPGFFLEYYPDPSQPTPTAKAEILETFVRMKFPDEYDADRGLVIPNSSTPVRERDVVEGLVPEQDRFARYFCERNPGYLDGHFLACLTRIDRSNVTRLGARILAGPTTPPL